jgi:hypothetical protein
MWTTLGIARSLWRDAPADDAVLTAYLSAAQAACEAFAPAFDTPGFVPEGYGLAVVMQARNIWNAGKAAPATGDFDGSGYGIASFPLDWTVQQLLRPRRGLGAVV